MYLLIDMSEKDAIAVSLFDETRVEKKEVVAKNRELLPVIEDMLSEHSLTKKDIQGIVTVVKSGSFTSTRIGCVITNVFAYVMKIKVLAVSKEEGMNPQALIPRLKGETPGKYITASYSGEPNIGGK